MKERDLSLRQQKFKEKSLFVPVKCHKVRLELFCEVLCEKSGEQRTKFAHSACITFSQYCIWSKVTPWDIQWLSVFWWSFVSCPGVMRKSKSSYTTVDSWPLFSSSLMMISRFPPTSIILNQLSLDWHIPSLFNLWNVYKRKCISLGSNVKYFVNLYPCIRLIILFLLQTNQKGQSE